MSVNNKLLNIDCLYLSNIIGLGKKMLKVFFLFEDLVFLFALTSTVFLVSEIKKIIEQFINEKRSKNRFSRSKPSLKYKPPGNKEEIDL
jgi:hypothetical protein